MFKLIAHSITIIYLLTAVSAKSQQNTGIHSDNSKMDTVLYSDGKPIKIEINNGRITKLVRKPTKSTSSENVVYVAPGFIDHQVNGYLSHAFVGEDLNEEQVEKITKAFWKKGITTFYPTLTTESNQVLLRNFGILNEILKNGELAQSLPGFHLEGPYISPLDGFRGAHNPAHIRKPDWEEFKAWHGASGKRIKEVTIAPEWEGSAEFIKKCRENNIKVALGHTNANALQINEAVALGASLSTHLGNGCANTIHRHHNPIWPQLSNDGLMTCIIADGHHLTKEEVRTFYKAKGPDNIILVSDITRLAGMPPGRYKDFDQEVVLTEEGAIMMPSENVLAGASFLITRGIENVIKFTGCSLEQAVHMVTSNPAKALDLEDRGVIAVGKRADLVYFTLDQGKLDIIKTVVGGKVVFDKVKMH